MVSEETGAISAASRGMLARYTSAEELTEPIAYLYQHGDSGHSGPLNSFLSLFGRGQQESPVADKAESSQDSNELNSSPTSAPDDLSKDLQEVTEKLASTSGGRQAHCR